MLQIKKLSTTFINIFSLGWPFKPGCDAWQELNRWIDYKKYAELEGAVFTISLNHSQMIISVSAVINCII